MFLIPGRKPSAVKNISTFLVMINNFVFGLTLVLRTFPTFYQLLMSCSIHPIWQESVYFSVAPLWGRIQSLYERVICTHYNHTWADSKLGKITSAVEINKVRHLVIRSFPKLKIWKSLENTHNLLFNLSSLINSWRRFKTKQTKLKPPHRVVWRLPLIRQPKISG